MSLGRCIPDLVAQGALSADQAARAQQLFDSNVADLSKSMSPFAAEAAATRRTLDALDFDALRKRQAKLLQVKAQDFADDWLTRGGERWGGGDRGGAGGGLTPGSGPGGPVNPRAGHTLVGLVEARRKAIEGEAFGLVREVLARHRKTLTGQLRDPAGMDEIGREAFGEASGSLAARELAGAIADAQERLRLRANAAGASIGKIEKRGFAQYHDSRKVAETGFDQWFADHSQPGVVDRARTIDETTGQPFTDDQFREVMRSVYDAIASDGYSKGEPGAYRGLSYANRLGQHRFLHYASYDAWKAMQDKYGAGTAFDALLGEVKGMSRAIAAMELLGPDPERTVRYVQDRIAGDPRFREPGQLRARDKSAKEALVVQRLWDEYTGALRQPESRGLALGFSAYRAIATAAKLGRAPLSAIGDIGFGMATRRFNGLPEAGIVRDYLKLLNPASAEDRKLAARLSFVPETWTSQVSGTSRILGEELTGEIARRVADGVLRVSGLNAITDAGRSAHGLVTFVHLTQTRQQGWAELEPSWRAALERYRIGEAEWDQIRAAPVSEDIDLVEPSSIEDVELRTRFLEMAHSEQDFAVPVPDLETRSVINANVRKGTVLGELLRSSPLMFKTFTIATLLRHGGRMVEQSGAAGRAGYLLSVVVPVTLFAALGVQLKEIAKGRDPRPMDPTTDEGQRLWAQAMFTGGGLSIAGDLAGVTAEGRYMGLEQFTAGPLLGDLSRVQGAVHGIAEGKERAPWQLARVARENIPGQNVWYTQLVVDRLLADQIQRQIDPEYDDSWRQMQKRAASQGQEFYWAPGEYAPSRAPDVANALEGGTP